MHKQIKSTQNPAIKNLLQLQEKSRHRRREGLFLVEGMREITLALKGGFLMKSIYFCSNLFPEPELQKLIGKPKSEIIEISLEVYQKIAYRGSTEGIVAVFKGKENRLEDLKFSNENPLILVAEAPEKPGNIGALLRTADAAHLDAVIIANPKTDLYNPNIIRSSVGGVFTSQVATGNTNDIISFLKRQNINMYAAALQASKVYTKVNFKEASAIVVGTEATGLTNDWLENSDQNILIPMEGELDSMNVSVAAGILIFEAKRQRNFS